MGIKQKNVWSAFESFDNRKGHRDSNRQSLWDQAE